MINYIIEPDIQSSLDKDVLKLYTLYLEKLEKMTPRERDIFIEYFYLLNNPAMVVENDK